MIITIIAFLLGAYIAAINNLPVLSPNLYWIALQTPDLSLHPSTGQLQHSSRPLKNRGYSRSRTRMRSVGKRRSEEKLKDRRGSDC